MKRGWLFAIFLLSCSTIALLNARSRASDPTPTYVGSETCKTCHEGQWEAFQSNPHHLAELDSTAVGERVGCESCHGPGSLHAEAAGDKSNPGFATIRNLKAMPPSQAAAVCRTCHTAGEQFYWDQSMHANRNVSCLNCHSIHHSKAGALVPLLRSEGTSKNMLINAGDVNELCLSCHKNKRGQLSRSAHMPLREGAMSCVDCHNAHGSAGPHQIRAASNNELCTSCHADKRGPFLWEHPPVRENCLTCHEPHGSNNDKVLAGKRPFLCQRCHIATRHPSTLYDLPDLQSNRLVNRSCTNCHSQIHGSNHPSGKTLLR